VNRADLAQPLIPMNSPERPSVVARMLHAPSTSDPPSYAVSVDDAGDASWLLPPSPAKTAEERVEYVAKSEEAGRAPRTERTRAEEPANPGRAMPGSRLPIGLRLPVRPGRRRCTLPRDSLHCVRSASATILELGLH
jgi:hypothetical protein